MFDNVKFRFLLTSKLTKTLLSTGIIFDLGKE